MTIAANLGYPRMGFQRELKWALERFWKGKADFGHVEETARDLRAANWKTQKEAGITRIPSNDFALYDQMLDMACLLGCIPERYRFEGGNVDTSTYFAMARGMKRTLADGTVIDEPACEMTKWFDTNYHYIVPEFGAGQKFALSSTKPFDHFLEAKALGIHTRPVLIGPLSFLLLGKDKGSGDPLALLPKLLPVYIEVLKRLEGLGADWVQIDEPCLVLDIGQKVAPEYVRAYLELSQAVPNLKIMLATYFGDLGKNLELAMGLPVAGVHLDLVRGAGQLDAALALDDGGKVLSLGLVEGRNIWGTNLDKALETAEKVVAKLGKGRVEIAPSCSLLHVPVSLRGETALDPTIKSWLAYAEEKLGEVATIAGALARGRDAVSDALHEARQAALTRRTSPLLHDPKVRERYAAVDESMMRRASVYAKRREAQAKSCPLPPLPTTTIGSFPQTNMVRQWRTDLKAGKVTQEQYDAFMKEEIERCIRWQEEAGIDVLVHGEFERNDMVEHFATELNGFAFTQNGWVQSYGSRCVKPPVIYGDVSRKRPMTVEWSAYAQSLTKLPVKGMLTGPVTMLQWSFVRDDQPRSDTAMQLALALRDEVVDLEKAGIRVIQIDEPAIREGLPLRKADWEDYLRWAVAAFRLSCAGVTDETQVHTHMCYSEFNDIIDSVAAMDADVVSIETSRSQMELLDCFTDFKYPNGIGPGVYDIHSPRVPARSEMEDLLRLALKRLQPEQLWVNPDCGLKTRGWEEVRLALGEMVSAAKTLRSEIVAGGK